MTTESRQIYEALIPNIQWTEKQEISARCPLHSDNNPSLSINMVSDKWFCHACNKGGLPINLYMEVKGIDFKTAQKELGLKAGNDKKIIEDVYDYISEEGRILFQEVKYFPKDFKQRRPGEHSKWIWNLRGIELVLFDLPEVIKANIVFVVEGPKDCLTLKNMGLVATTNPLGAGKWKPEYNGYFTGKNVIILCDNDEPGRKHAQDVAQNLYGIAKSIKVIELPGLPEKGDVSDWVKGEGNDKTRLRQIVAATSEWTPSEEINNAVSDQEWPDFIPFDNLSALPDFPTTTLPTIGREIVLLVGEIIQVDTALPATIYLSILSAALAKKATVDLNTHKEPLNIYTCSIYESGERKSSTIGTMTKTLYDYQKQTQQDMAHEIKKAKIIYETSNERLKTLQKRAAKENSFIEREQLEQEIIELAKNITEPPESPVFLVDDVTPEELGRLMSNNNERMAVFSSEGGIFQNIAGRYDDKKGGNVDLILKGHSGDPWSCHRVGRESKTMLAPALTMGLTVQPDVLNEIGINKVFRGRGVLARFLYLIGKPHAGYRVRQTKTIPEKILQAYAQHIDDLLGLPLSDQSLSLDPDAHLVWNEFYEDIEKEMRSGGDLEHLKDWGSKLAGQVARIAGLLHFATHGAKAINMPISVNSVNNSCVIGSFFKEHAVAAFGLMQAHPGIESAKIILNYITREKVERFKGRDAIRHTGIRTMEDVTPGLNILLERGYIREVEKIKIGVGRPEAVSYIVNPNINI